MKVRYACFGVMPSGRIDAPHSGSSLSSMSTWTRLTHFEYCLIGSDLRDSTISKRVQTSLLLGVLRLYAWNRDYTAVQLRTDLH